MKLELISNPIYAPYRVALVHDWLTGMRGGEKCLEVLCELFPDAPIFTLLAYPEQLSRTIRRHEIRTSFLQRLPFARNGYRNYLPLFPRAIESFDLDEFDLVISTSHAVAKGVIPAARALHVSYVHTPMRYIWNMFDAYFGKNQVGSIKRAFIGYAAKRLRRWDVASFERVDHFIANSHHVRKRIEQYWQRTAEVIYPPVDVGRFQVSHEPGEYFLVVSALVPYKRVDIAIEACNKIHHPLRIIGDGPEKERLKALAGPTVRFEGWLSSDEISAGFQHCKALLFPGEEDFGIVPVEAMACGKPVVAFGVGGATETVVEGQTGVFFRKQCAEALIEAIRDLESRTWRPEMIRKHAESFDREIYKHKMLEAIRLYWSNHCENA